MGMTMLRNLDDIYQAAIKNWLEWEDKTYDEAKFYEGYKSGRTINEIYDIISEDASTFEWIVEQLSDAVDVVIKKYPHEVFSILQRVYGKNTVKKYLDREKVKSEDIEKKNQNFLDALFSLLIDKAVYNGEFWVNRAESDYAEFLQKKVKKFFGNKSLKGTRISAPQQMRKAAPQRKRAVPKNHTPCVKVNVRRMF